MAAVLLRHINEPLQPEIQPIEAQSQETGAFVALEVSNKAQMIDNADPQDIKHLTENQAIEVDQKMERPEVLE